MGKLDRTGGQKKKNVPLMDDFHAFILIDGGGGEKQEEKKTIIETIRAQ